MVQPSWDCSEQVRCSTGCLAWPKQFHWNKIVTHVKFTWKSNRTLTRTNWYMSVQANCLIIRQPFVDDVILFLDLLINILKQLNPQLLFFLFCFLSLHQMSDGYVSSILSILCHIYRGEVCLIYFNLICAITFCKFTFLNISLFICPWTLCFE